MTREIAVQIPNFKAQQISTGTEHTVIRDLENNIWVFGCNDYGQLGLGNTKNKYGLSQIANIKTIKIAADCNSTAVIPIINVIFNGLVSYFSHFVEFSSFL